MLNFIKNLGPAEWIIIGVILVVFFGSKRIANLGKSAGEATREVKRIKKELTEASADVKSETDITKDK